MWGCPFFKFMMSVHVPALRRRCMLNWSAVVYSQHSLFVLHKNTYKTYYKGLSTGLSLRGTAEILISTNVLRCCMLIHALLLLPQPTKERKPLQLRHTRQHTLQTSPPAFPCIQNPISGDIFHNLCHQSNTRVPLQSVSHFSPPPEGFWWI